jgi:FkbM family methyltransferase
MPSPFSSIRVCVTPDVSLKFVKPGDSAFDLDLLAFVQNFIKPDYCVWDIGANLGILTFSAASIVGSKGQIIAVEPDPKLSSLLRRSASVQPETSAVVEILEAAVSSSSGSETFRIAARGRASNALGKVTGSSQMGGVRKEISVNCITLDDLLLRFRAPDLIKLDIEGAELSALKGGEKILNSVRPYIYCEMGKGSQPVLDVFDSSGYWLFNPNKPVEEKMRLDPKNYSDLVSAVPSRTSFSANILAIPQEKFTSSDSPNH